MNNPLRILYVEDSKIDAELVVRELARAGFDPTYQLVMNESEFATELQTMPDVIFSDFSLPNFDGMRALELLQESKLEIPFILISGTLGEDLAVMSIKRGAADYLMKDRLTRLGAAVERALDEQRQKIEKRQSDAAFKQSEECLRIVSNFARIGFVVVNAEFQLVFANPAYSSLFSLALSGMTGKNVLDLLPIDIQQPFRLRLEKAFAGERSEYELRMPGENGQSYYVVNFEPVVYGSQNAKVVVGIMDITARRNTEEQLRQSQKMEAFGQLAGGIAHDFNNILTVICTYSSLLGHSHALNTNEQFFAKEIEKASQQAADLTKRLLEFSRGQMQRPEAINLNELIVNTQKLLELTLGKRVELSLILAPELRQIWMDKTELSQILMNLAINSRDAMPNGGRLEIKTEMMELPHGKTENGTPDKPERFVLLTVSDTGNGMNEDVKKRLFEPFFTTKPVGKGTGLGLAIVHGIVCRSGGDIDVLSEVGNGTTFCIYLPPSIEDSKRTEASISYNRPIGGSEWILVVDDDEQVRKATCTILLEYGYKVNDVESGPKAIQAMVEFPNKIQLLITDQLMPEMTGLQLIEEFKNRIPKIPVMLISGFIPDSDTWNYVTTNKLNFLRKPFSPDALASLVRSILNQTAEIQS